LLRWLPPKACADEKCRGNSTCSEQLPFEGAVEPKYCAAAKGSRAHNPLEAVEEKLVVPHKGEGTQTGRRRGGTCRCHRAHCKERKRVEQIGVRRAPREVGDGVAKSKHFASKVHERKLAVHDAAYAALFRPLPALHQRSAL
jgi:hypothetical protein